MIEIRELSVADYDAICEVWRACGTKLRPQGRESRESFARQMAGGTQMVLGAFTDGRLVGVSLVTHDGRKGWINRLGVLPDCQRQGIGAGLIRASEKLLHDNGLTIVAALVEHYNAASLSLFQHEGYHVEDTYYVTKRDSPDA
ncbi:MAG TPA: GNAT family N-acetyltransferase [Aggregatilineales bacterium]|nr:GNAT family N-acetyltransferase [Aggregatilineales bacterium]